MAATDSERRQLDWQSLLDTALTMPGSVGNEYNRFHNYSWGNLVLLWSQGVAPQPVATYKKWQELGRQVLRGAKAREIIRPITVKSKDQVDDQGNPKTYTRFKPVRCLFPLSETTGADLPPVEIPDWDADRALSNLNITRVPFADFDGNTAGYSVGRNLAINPVAAHPTKTLLHEMAHIVGGHTAPERVGEYRQHRGRFELEAEAPAYLVSKELAIDDPAADASSRGYIQGWLRGEPASDESVRLIFKSTTTILAAGRLAVEGVGDAA